MKKLSEKKIYKTYNNIIALCKMLNKTEFTQPVLVQHGEGEKTIYITIKLSENNPDDESKPESV